MKSEGGANCSDRQPVRQSGRGPSPRSLQCLESLETLSWEMPPAHCPTKPEGPPVGNEQLGISFSNYVLKHARLKSQGRVSQDR